MAIQLLTKKEAESLPTSGFGKKHLVHQMIAALKPGQVLSIGRQDFRWRRRTPNYFCIRLSKKTNARYKVENLAGRIGWKVERLE